MQRSVKVVTNTDLYAVNRIDQVDSEWNSRENMRITSQTIQGKTKSDCKGESDWMTQNSRRIWENQLISARSSQFFGFSALPSAISSSSLSEFVSSPLEWPAWYSSRRQSDTFPILRKNLYTGNRYLRNLMLQWPIIILGHFQYQEVDESTRDAHVHENLLPILLQHCAIPRSVSALAIKNCYVIYKWDANRFHELSLESKQCFLRF